MIFHYAFHLFTPSAISHTPRQPLIITITPQPHLFIFIDIIIILRPLPLLPLFSLLILFLFIYCWNILLRPAYCQLRYYHLLPDYCQPLRHYADYLLTLLLPLFIIDYAIIIITGHYYDNIIDITPFHLSHCHIDAITLRWCLMRWWYWDDADAITPLRWCHYADDDATILRWYYFHIIYDDETLIAELTLRRDFIYFYLIILH